MSQKQHLQNARGKNVPVDYFLFSCLEYERTSRASQDEQPTKGRWPLLFSARVNELPLELQGPNLETLLDRLCLWYSAQYPEMVDEIPLDHEQLNAIVGPFMKLTLDIADLVLVKTGESLPSFNQESPSTKEVWDAIRKVLKDDFPGYHLFFLRFLEWAFCNIAPEEIEPGSRPPVGRNSPFGGGGHRPPPRGPGGGGGGGGHRPPRGPGGGGGGRPPYGGGGGGNEHRRFNKGNGGGGGGGEDDPLQRTAQLEKEALASVDEAIASLNSNPDMEEVFLKPVNSFYRRLQHQHAVNQGFQSCSVGDGQERGVKISRPVDGQET